MPSLMFGLVFLPRSAASFTGSPTPSWSMVTNGSAGRTRFYV
jgi:hypothetical protein